MRSKSCFFILLMFLMSILINSYSLAQSSNNGDKELINLVFKNLSDAWEQADGNAWGSYFTEDADFTVWFGLHLKGRKEIAEGHQWVFDTVYPDTRYVFEINDLKYLNPDIAVVHLNASVIEPGGELPDEPHSLPVAVLRKIDGEWEIVMFHNLKNQIMEIEEMRKKGESTGDVRN